VYEDFLSKWRETRNEVAGGATYVVLAERGRGNIELDASEQTTSRPSGKQPTQIRIQTISTRRKRKKRTKKRKPLQENYELRCGKCDEHVSKSSDLRILRPAHRVTLDPMFHQRVVFRPHPRPESVRGGLRKRDKMYCKRCGCEWGCRAECKYYTRNISNSSIHNFLCCVIKLKNLVMVRPDGNVTHRKQWKDVAYADTRLATEDDVQILIANSFALRNIPSI
jgi:hypothetical protein